MQYVLVLLQCNQKCLQPTVCYSRQAEPKTSCTKSRVSPVVSLQHVTFIPQRTTLTRFQLCNRHSALPLRIVDCLTLTSNIYFQWTVARRKKATANFLSSNSSGKAGLQKSNQYSSVWLQQALHNCGFSNGRLQ